jgi:hypothetical protein
MMLNGFGQEPWLKMDRSHLKIAKERLSQFDTIFILEQPKTFGALRKYEIDTREFVKKNVNTKKQEIGMSREEFRKDNALDFELYDHAVELALSKLDIGEQDEIELDE